MASSRLYEQLKDGPIFLILGQHHLAVETGRDPLLAEIRRKYSIEQESHGYFDLFAKPGSDDDAQVLAWIDERCRRLAAPEWLIEVAQLPWNGVFASALDTVWPSAFRLPWRDIQPIFDDRYRPMDPRNRRMLHCFCCFGLANRVEVHERPPLTRFDLSARSQTAIAVLRRLPELVTPFGTLIIEGYAGRHDWLTPEALMPALASLGAEQVHLFSATPELLADDYIRELQRRHVLIAHPESFGAAVSEGKALGAIHLGLPDELATGGSRITVGHSVIEVPSEIRNQVQHSAVIVDDLATLAPSAISPDAKYREFREFLATSEGIPRWSGFTRGFAFVRDFFHGLYSAVEARLGEAERLVEAPILLHGQTGTGKTIALAMLAHAIRVARTHPVLFIERRSRRPNFADIEVFCRWCEEHGGAASLIVWDGMLDFNEYAELQRYLASRGRKAVLVGSSYFLSDPPREAHAILAPPELLSTEEPRFVAFLRDVDETFAPLADRLARLHDGSFLVALYRLLPPTRAGVRAGLGRELEQAEVAIAARSASQPPRASATGVLATALLRANVVTPTSLSAEPVRSVAGESFNDFQDLTALVMVAARHGIRTPIEVLLRAIGHQHFFGLIDLIKGVDIIRWFEDEIGNIELGARNALEARLLVESRVGGAAAEISFVRRLLSEVRDVAEGGFMSREGAFAADLIRAVGPNSPDAGLYYPYFSDLAATLRELREVRGVQSLGLMLAEANLEREGAKIQDEGSGTVVEGGATGLARARKVLQEALLQADAGSSVSRRIKARLLSELAATLGMECRRAVQSGAPTSQVVDLVGKVRDAVLEARRQEPSAYHPLDIFSWVAPAALKSQGLSEQQRAELTSDLADLFQAVEADDFDAEQQHRFYARRIEVAEVFGDLSLSDESFERLKQMGSAAGYYVRASQIAGGLQVEPPTRARACDAVAYLRSNLLAIRQDPRCMTLLLRCTWLCNVGVPLFAGERVTPALEPAGWLEMLSLVRDVESSGKPRRPVDLAFLRAAALFHTGAVGEAFDVFRHEVEAESRVIQGRRRIVRTLLASNADGSPRKFHGTISWLAPDHRRGEVFVEELRRNVGFLAHEFRSNLDRGQSLGEFHIAFNLLGPLAEPAVFVSERRRDGRRV